MKTYFICLFFPVFFLFPDYSNAQPLPVNLRFNKFTTENGLSDNFIHDILKDRNGYLWISTQNGMNRFDGVDFKTFFKNPEDSNSLPSSYVSSLAEDSLGRIWAATAGGLSMYNPFTGKFWNFIPPKEPYFRKRIYKVIKARDGSIWFSTLNHLSTIDLLTLRITTYPVAANSTEIRNVTIDWFFEDHNGNFWFNSNLGLVYLTRKHM